VRSTRAIPAVASGSAIVGWNGLRGSRFRPGARVFVMLRMRITRTPLIVSSCGASGVASVSTVISCPRRTISSPLVAMLRSSPPITGA
jgi:hypothetical protein